MLRRTIAPLLLLLAACSTTQTVSPRASTTPCNPADALIQAVLWNKSAAEHDAATLGIFANARRALDAALEDPTWVGAAEETTNDPAQPPAVILDLDETILDNSPSEYGFMRLGKTYEPSVWKQWVAQSAALEVPGARDFLLYAKSRGVTPFYITNRALDEKPGTRANLERLGYPLSSQPDTLLHPGERPEWTSDKSSRRAYVAASYRVLLLLGDDLNDFANARDKSIEERDAIVEQKRDWWGTRWFLIPNPMYGSWETRVAGNGTLCEKMQKKIDALK